MNTKAEVENEMNWDRRINIYTLPCGGSEDKESACNVGDPGLIPRSGRSPGEGHGNPLQYSCLENPMDRGAWWATYSPWSPKESDTTEKLTLSLFMYQIDS